MKRYPGLSSFSTGQSGVFFGRDMDKAELSKLIFVERKVLLYSKSGYGKTSLLNAGVIPELQKYGGFEFIKVRFRTFTKESTSPNDTFLQSVRQHPDFLDADKSLTLIDKYAQEYADEYWSVFKKNQLAGNMVKTYVLIFDQFEELFSYPDEHIKTFKNRLSEIIYANKLPSFINELEKRLFANRSAVNDDEFALLYQPVNIKVVFTIRSDRLSELNRLADKIPDIQSVFYELQPLNNEQARQAIEKPSDKPGEFESLPFTFNPDAINKIINALTENGREIIETTQLQIVCQRIEEDVMVRNQKDLVVHAGDIPDFKDIFLNFYNGTISKVKSDEVDKVRQFIEDQLIVEGRRVSLDQFVCYRYVSEETLMTLLEAHFIRAEQNSVGGISYELGHDTLVPPIQEMAEKRRRHDREKQIADEIALAERQQRLEEKAKSARTLKWLLAVMTILFITAIFATVFAKYQQKLARNASKEALNQFDIANEEKDKAQLLLNVIMANIKLRQAFLLRDNLIINQALNSEALDKQIKFKATAEKKYKGPYPWEYKMFPIEESIPGGLKSIALITFIIDHPTFKNPLYLTAIDTKFTANYDGKGAPAIVKVLIEYSDPYKPPSVSQFNMHEILEIIP